MSTKNTKPEVAAALRTTLPIELGLLNQLIAEIEKSDRNVAVDGGEDISVLLRERRRKIEAWFLPTTRPKVPILPFHEWQVDALWVTALSGEDMETRVRDLRCLYMDHYSREKPFLLKNLAPSPADFHTIKCGY